MATMSELRFDREGNLACEIVQMNDIWGIPRIAGGLMLLSILVIAAGFAVLGMLPQWNRER